MPSARKNRHATLSEADAEAAGHASFAPQCSARRRGRSRDRRSPEARPSLSGCYRRQDKERDARVRAAGADEKVFDSDSGSPVPNVMCPYSSSGGRREFPLAGEPSRVEE